MTYSEDDLREALQLLERLAPNLDTHELHTTARRHPRRVVLLMSIAAGVLLIAAVTSISLLLSRHRGPGPATSTSTSRTTNFEGLILRYPTSWREAPVTWFSTGPSGPVGFLTDAKVGAECNTSGCGAPVRTLGPNQTLITVSASTFGFPLSKPNALVAGFPALKRSYSPRHGCPAGTLVEQSIDIAVQWKGSTGTERNMMLTACFAGPDTTPATTAFQQVLRAATYKYPPDGRAAIHGTVTISPGTSATSGQPSGTPVSGNLLVYTDAAHTGMGLFNSSLANGTYYVGVGPGTYYIEITRSNGVPCDAGPVVVPSNHNVRADITCRSN